MDEEEGKDSAGEGEVDGKLPYPLVPPPQCTVWVHLTMKGKQSCP